MPQGYLSRIEFSAAWMRRLFNVWPPFRAAGIRVTRVDPDFRHVTVELRAKLLNRNFVGSHFGGSMFAMADPFYMIMMMRNLGRDYVVWDKAAAIRFLKPGRGTLTARFELTQAMVDEAVSRTAGGSRHEPTYAVQITDGAGLPVAAVEKTLYIRRADSYRPALTGN
jgi:acyl-coenzyme A thioesterase PaaI-like protein